MALRGIKVLEFAGLAPAPYCGMILSDFGADVIRIDRAGGSSAGSDTLSRGKRSIAINLKQKEGVELVKNMASKVDVLVEPFRRGVMEKLGIGPEILLQKNPRLIYARLTGFGQDGPLADRAGHDINYLAISGTLSTFGRKGTKPYAPINTLADFAGGGLMCAMGIAMALIARGNTGRGQVIDANMVEGAAYVGSFLWSTRGLPFWGKERGEGMLDGGAPFYDTYETQDGLYMSVGALEPQFYAELLKGLELNADDYSQFDDWPSLREKFTALFKSKTQKQWSEIFEDRDACVAPVVPIHQADQHRHNKSRQSFINDPDGGINPKPAPRLSDTPAKGVPFEPLVAGQNSSSILQEFGYGKEQTDKLISSGVVTDNGPNAKL